MNANKKKMLAAMIAASIALPVATATYAHAEYSWNTPEACVKGERPITLLLQQVQEFQGKGIPGVKVTASKNGTVFFEGTTDENGMIRVESGWNEKAFSNLGNGEFNVTYTFPEGKTPVKFWGADYGKEGNKIEGNTITSTQMVAPANFVCLSDVAESNYSRFIVLFDKDKAEQFDKIVQGNKESNANAMRFGVGYMWADDQNKDAVKAFGDDQENAGTGPIRFANGEGKRIIPGFNYKIVDKTNGNVLFQADNVAGPSFNAFPPGEAGLVGISGHEVEMTITAPKGIIFDSARMESPEGTTYSISDDKKTIVLVKKYPNLESDGASSEKLANPVDSSVFVKTVDEPDKPTTAVDKPDETSKPTKPSDKPGNPTKPSDKPGKTTTPDKSKTQDEPTKSGDTSKQPTTVTESTTETVTETSDVVTTTETTALVQQTVTQTQQVENHGFDYRAKDHTPTQVRKPGGSSVGQVQQLKNAKGPKVDTGGEVDKSFIQRVIEFVLGR